MPPCLNEHMGASSIPDVKTYKQGGLTFTLAPKRVIVQTPMQTFYLVPRASYWHRKIHLVRAMIQLGEIRDLNELAAFCGDCVEWRSTSLSVEQLVYTEGIWRS